MDYAFSLLKKTKLGNNIGVKTYTFQFSNETSKPVLVLLEEDPDGMVERRMGRMRAIKTVGDAARRFQGELQQDYDTICGTSFPVQEVKIIPEQVKSLQMRSEVVRCSVGLLDWDGVLKIVMVRKQMLEGDILRITLDFERMPGKSLRSDLMEPALRALGLRLGFEKRKEAVADRPAAGLEAKPPPPQEVPAQAQQCPQQPPKEAMAPQPQQCPQRSPKERQIQLQQGASPASWSQNPKRPEQQQQVPPMSAPNEHLLRKQETAYDWNADVQRLEQQQKLLPQPPKQARPVSSPAHTSRGNQQRVPMKMLLQEQPGALNLRAKQPVALPPREEANQPPVTQEANRGIVPPGFVPTTGAVSVYSNSSARWLAGMLVGISIGATPAAPPGAVCVQYELPDPSGRSRQHTQKILFPDQIPNMLRAC